MPASTCICLSTLSGVWGGYAGGWGGDDVHATETCVFFSFVDLLLLCCGAVQWWGGDDVHANATCVFFSLLDYVGCSCTADADSDVADVAIVLVVISGCLLLDFPHVYHAKTSSFCSFPDKNFATDPKIEHKKHEKLGICDTFAKTLPKTENIGKRNHRNVVLLTKTSQNTGFSCCRPKKTPNINDTPCAAADARATLLLVPG